LQSSEEEEKRTKEQRKWKIDKEQTWERRTGGGNTEKGSVSVVFIIFCLKSKVHVGHIPASFLFVQLVRYFAPNPNMARF